MREVYVYDVKPVCVLGLHCFYVCMAFMSEGCLSLYGFNVCMIVVCMRVMDVCVICA